MKMRPILFSTAMVQAILEGRKTQTRRVVKPKHQPIETAPNDFLISLDLCPYGQPGDILWVRETWGYLPETDGGNCYFYKADTGISDQPTFTWRPSIYMPFAAARIFLRIKAVRVERLQDISGEDAVAEGIYTEYPSDTLLWMHGWKDYLGGESDLDAYGSFASLWQSINGPESWDANPWVWVVEFERISREEVQP